MDSKLMRLVLDLDGTITDADPAKAYAVKRLNHAVIELIRDY